MREEGAQVGIATQFGALLPAWAEGPAEWLDRQAPDLWGFAARR